MPAPDATSALLLDTLDTLDTAESDPSETMLLSLDLREVGILLAALLWFRRDFLSYQEDVDGLCTKMHEGGTAQGFDRTEDEN